MRKSLVERARKRTVLEGKTVDTWIVKGIPGLGDKYDEYLVRVNFRNTPGGEYVCDCHDHGHGEYRARKTCSHVTAVILYRDGKLAPQKKVDGFVPYTPPQNEWQVDFKVPEPGEVDPPSTSHPQTAPALDEGQEGEGQDGEEVPTAEPSPFPLPSTEICLCTLDEAMEGHRSRCYLNTDEPDGEVDWESPFPLPSTISTSSIDPPMPAKFSRFEHEQWPTIEKVVEAFEAGFKVVMLDAPTGCLSGDTEIQYNRAGITRRIRLSELVRKFNGGESSVGRGGRVAMWDPAIATRVRCGNVERGIIQLGALKGAYESGEKETFRVVTDQGNLIRATRDHRFFTEVGWLRLEAISVGMQVFVDSGQGTDRPKSKPQYKQVQGLFHHPYASRRNLGPGQGRGFSVPVHRLVAEADLNGVGYNTYVGMILDGDIGELSFLDPEVIAVHHRDHDSLNNHISNLMVLTHSEHQALHAQEGGTDHVQYRLAPSRVISIESAGMEMTYDLELESEPHNFIANGFVVHNSGKTLIAEAVRRILGVRGIYTCTTKTLQAQVMKPDDFGAYAKIVMGRRNYKTLNNPKVTAEDCTMKKRTLPACEGCPGWTAERSWRTDKVERKMQGQTSIVEMEDSDGIIAYHCANCHPVHLCPYEVAKREAGMARLAVLNTAYFLAENQYNWRKTPFKNWPLVILDEADRLEEELMRFVEVEIGPRVRKQLGIGLPAKKGDDAEWVRWLIEEVVPAIQAALKDLVDTAHDELDLIRKRKALTRLLDSVQWLISVPERKEGEAEDGEPVLQSGWVYTGYEKKEDHQATVTFKPVEVDELAQTFLWKHAQRFLIMSASFVSAEDTAAELGLEDGEWTVITMPSTFPPIQRPIIPVDVASVTNKTKETSYPLIARSIEKILDRHEGERVLIHTVSYDLGRQMMEHLLRTKHRRRLHTYNSADSRASALEDYLGDPAGVLLAPSFDRGVDLPKDDCRVIVIPKVPFGNLGDKQISTRFWGTGKRGKVWYKKKAIQTLCQMTGRGMRSVDDSCVTYVLDSEFDRLYAEARRMFPAWWAEAIVWDAYDPRWKGLEVSAEGLK